MEDKTLNSPHSVEGASKPAELKRPPRPENRKKKKRIFQHKKAKKKTGRPSKHTPEVVSKLEEAFKDDFTDLEACDYAGISTKSYYRWMKKDTLFRDKMHRAQRAALTALKNSAFAQARGDDREQADGALAFRILQTRQRDRYATKQELEVPPLPPLTLILPGSKAHPRFTAPPPKKD